MNFDPQTLSRLRGLTQTQRKRLVESLSLDGDLVFNGLLKQMERLSFLHGQAFGEWMDLLSSQLAAFGMSYLMPEFNHRLDAMLGIRRDVLAGPTEIEPLDGHIRKFDWFICHNSRDKDVMLKAVVPSLEANGMTCAYDITLLKPGFS